MITLNMQQKNIGIKIPDTAFSLENNIRTLAISVMDGLVAYDLTNKVITASFDITGVETGALTVTDGIVQLPVTSNLIKAGNNNFQLNFRWETMLEQSPIMTWFVHGSIQTTEVDTQTLDIISSLIAQVNEAISNVEEITAGAEGESAYEVAITNGFVGTETEWLTSLKGDDGAQGIQGVTGADGYTPVKGTDYFDGEQGIQGEQGIDGADGYTPIKGTDYFDGADGYTPVKGTDYYTPAEIATIKSEIETAIDAYISVADVSNVYNINFNNETSINATMTVADTTAKTVTVSNVPIRTEMYLELIYTSAAAITWFSGIIWLSGSAPTLTEGKTYRMSFFTSDGGTTWHGVSVGGW